MAGEDNCCASPPCLADRVDDAYAGFLPAGELAAALDRLIALAERDSRQVGQAWRLALGPISERLWGREPADPGEPVPGGATDLAEAAHALLPRIRDDRIHATLKRLLAEP